MDTPPRECDVCESALHLFQPACEECETPYEWSISGPCSECGREREYLEPCSCGASPSPWRGAESVALKEGTVTIDKDAVERPIAAGYHRHLGTIRGQWADYRRATDDGEFHVLVYLDHYELHVDEVGALDEPAKHGLRYGPKAAITTTTDIVRGLRNAAGRLGGWTRETVPTPSAFDSDPEQ